MTTALKRPRAEGAREMRVLSLFSGIGGMDLGLERAGMEVVGQCEIDPYCQRVLAKHWPSTPRWSDVHDLADEHRHHIEDRCGRIDMIAGGFPCQDVSNAGERAGISASRSGLYAELVRCLRVVRPVYALLENVAALLVRGMGSVLGDLAESGYDAEWDCVPACAVGARHLRDRVFILAATGAVDDLDRFRKGCLDRPPEACGRWLSGSSVRSCLDGGAWAGEPSVGRVAYGIPYGVVRVCRLGNSVVPKVAEYIGRAMMEPTP